MSQLKSFSRQDLRLSSQAPSGVVGLGASAGGLDRGSEFTLRGLDGYAVARVFRVDEGVEGLRLIALSGYALPHDPERSAEAGFERHPTNPLSPEKLEELLRSMPS